MLEWLFRRPANHAAERLIAEGNRTEAEGKLAAACERYREAVRASPNYARAHLNLAIALEASGDAAAAKGSFERALALEPADPYASYNLGKLFYTHGDLPEAERLLGQALRSRADFPEARVVLGCVLHALGKSAAAALELEGALRQRPQDFGARYHYARVLRSLNRLDEAKAALKRALVIEPDAVDLHAQLSDIFSSQGDLNAAAAELEAVVKLRPGWADALYNHGLVLKKLARLEAAESALRGAIAAEPGHAGAYRMLGGTLLVQCRADEALEIYRLGRERCPDDFPLESAEIFAHSTSERISEEDLFARHVAFGNRIERTHPAQPLHFSGPRDPERRLRVGYVSGDFRYHVVTLFMTPVVERHDRSAYEVVCYSTGEGADDFTRRLSGRADLWRDSSALSEAALAEAIHADGIDVLVDLGGHSGIAQLGVFARRPAPVQATWLGYANTTGMTRIQYRISDSVCDPPGLTDRYHAETVVRLAHSQWCYRPFTSSAAAQGSPAARNGYVTFGSFNQGAKLSPSTRAKWKAILAQVRDSHIVILGVPKGRAQDDLFRDLAGESIARARIILEPYVSLQDYFRWFDAVDIALDSTPWSGGTTTFDALWMGVPVLTVPGSRSASRSAASALTCVGLPEWIASSAEDYVRRAVRFAGERDLLAELRASLRSRMQASPVMDEERFVRGLEDAYRKMWRRWCETAGSQG